VSRRRRRFPDSSHRAAADGVCRAGHQLANAGRPNWPSHRLPVHLYEPLFGTNWVQSTAHMIAPVLIGALGRVTMATLAGERQPTSAWDEIMARTSAEHLVAIGCLVAAVASCSRDIQSEQLADRQVAVTESDRAAQVSLSESSGVENRADEPPNSTSSDASASEEIAGVESDVVATAAATTELSAELQDKIRTAAERNELVETDVAGDIDHVRTDLPHDGGILIGLELHFDYEAACLIDSLRPIYLTAKGEAQGERFGFSSPRSTIKARPHYAVGAIRYRYRHGIQKVQLVFMRIKGTRLDPSDFYESEVFGDFGDVEHTLSGNGAPVVGMRLANASWNYHVVGGLGLVLLGD
jgi:hypothetical protein